MMNFIKSNWKVILGTVVAVLVVDHGGQAIARKVMAPKAADPVN